MKSKPGIHCPHIELYDLQDAFDCVVVSEDKPWKIFSNKYHGPVYRGPAGPSMLRQNGNLFGSENFLESLTFIRGVQFCSVDYQK